VVTAARDLASRGHVFGRGAGRSGRVRRKVWPRQSDGAGRDAGVRRRDSDARVPWAVGGGGWASGRRAGVPAGGRDWGVEAG